MAKLVLTDVDNLSGNPGSAETAINANSDAIEAALENTLSRDGTMPNQMEADLDMNGFRILNTSDILTTGGGAEDIDYDNSASGLAADNVQDAIDELDAADNTISSDLDDVADDLAYYEAWRVIADGGAPTLQPMFAAGPASVNIGTNSTPAWDGTSLLNSIRRDRRTSTAALDNNAGSMSHHNTDGGVFRAASGSVRGGGFRLRSLFSPVTIKSDGRIYWFMHVVASQPFGDPSNLINIVGYGKDSTDTNLQVMHNDGSGVATKVDTGILATSLEGVLLRIRIECPASGTPVSLFLESLSDSGATVLHQTQITTNLPAANTGLGWVQLLNTGTSTTSVVIDAIHTALRWRRFNVVF